jgi:hypothetical protein
MRTGWRRTLHGERIRDEIGIVARAAGRGWYAYPMGALPPLGPFECEDDAEEAAERVADSGRTKGESSR